MKKYNILYMGTPEFAVPPLEKLYKDHNVLGVVCQPDRVNRRGRKIAYNPVKKFALENDLPIYQPEDINSDKAIKSFDNLDIDFIVVVAYGQYISKEVRSLPKEKIVNIHGSLLPKYRGAAPIHRAIMDREEFTGVTIMEVDKGMDTGDIFLEKKTEVNEKNLESLHDELSVLGSELIIEYLEKYSQNAIVPVAQKKELVSYAEKVSRDDGILDFENANVELGKILGLYPRPGASFDYKGEKVKALKGKICKENPDPTKNPGDILSIDDSGILVNTGDARVLITEIQFPGNRPMKVSDYIKGNELETNVNLRGD